MIDVGIISYKNYSISSHKAKNKIFQPLRDSIKSQGDNCDISLPLSELNSINSPIYPDRKEWFNKMAWTQYTRPEFKEPYFWNLVKENLLA